MEEVRAKLVQYRVLADHRLHFGRLYFQVIGINLTLLVVASCAIAVGRPEWWTAMRLLAGLMLIGTGLVAARLNSQEALYASALREIEEEEAGMLRLPETRPPGARQLVVLALVAAGLVLTMATATTALHTAHDASG